MIRTITIVLKEDSVWVCDGKNEKTIMINTQPIIDMSRDGTFLMIAEPQADGSEKLLFATNDKFIILRDN